MKMNKYIVAVLIFLGMAWGQIAITNQTNYHRIFGTNTHVGTNSGDGTYSNFWATNGSEYTYISTALVFSVDYNTWTMPELTNVFQYMEISYDEATTNYYFLTNIVVNNDVPVVAITNTLQYKTNSGTITLKGLLTNSTYTFLNNLNTLYLVVDDETNEVPATTAWTTNIDTTALTDGTNVYSLYATGYNERVSTTVLLTNIVDNSPPVFGITNFTNLQILTNSGNFTFRGTNYENWSTVSTIYIKISNNYGVVKTNLSASVSNGGFNFTIDMATLPSDKYYIAGASTNSVSVGTNYFMISFNITPLVVNSATIAAGTVNVKEKIRRGEAIKTVAVSAIKFGDREITYNLWNDVYIWATNNGYSFDNEGTCGSGGTSSNLMPVVEVSWYDAVKWCNAYSEKVSRTPCYYTNTNLDSGHIFKTGRVEITSAYVNWTTNGYRLPTEAEWIKAYYGGVSGEPVFYWGNRWDYQQAYAWARPNSAGETHLTATKTTNQYLLYDMSGNAAEWVWDFYIRLDKDTGTSVYGYDTATSYRVFKGGHFNSSVADIIPFTRPNTSPRMARDYLGFRVVSIQ